MVKYGKVTGRQGNPLDSIYFRGAFGHIIAGLFQNYKDDSLNLKPHGNGPDFIEKTNNPAFGIKKRWYEELRRKNIPLNQRSIEDSIKEGVCEDMVLSLQKIANKNGRGRLDNVFGSFDLVTTILMYKRE